MVVADVVIVILAAEAVRQGSLGRLYQAMADGSRRRRMARKGRVTRRTTSSANSHARGAGIPACLADKNVCPTKHHSVAARIPSIRPASTAHSLLLLHVDTCK